MAPGPLDPVQGASELQMLKNGFGLSCFCKAPAKGQPARMKNNSRAVGSSWEGQKPGLGLP